MTDGEKVPSVINLQSVLNNEKLKSNHVSTGQLRATMVHRVGLAVFSFLKIKNNQRNAYYFCFRFNSVFRCLSVNLCECVFFSFLFSYHKTATNEIVESCLLIT